MILTFRCTFGTLPYLRLVEDFGSGLKIEALEFVNGLPIEWRLTAPDTVFMPWTRGMPARASARGVLPSSLAVQ